MTHCYQSRPGDGDSNRDCECDIGYSHSTRPDWRRTAALAVTEIARIHAEALTGPLSASDRNIVLTEIARIQATDAHLDRLIGLVRHIDGIHMLAPFMRY